MAVTVTYNFQLVQNLDLTRGPTVGSVDVTSLANGGFAAIGNRSTTMSAIDIFNAGNASTGGAANIPGFGGAIDQLSNGNIVAVTRTSAIGGTSLSIWNGTTGANVLAPGLAGLQTSSGLDVAALANGGFVITGGVTGSNVGVFEVYNNAGVYLTGVAVAGDAQNMVVAALDDGGFAIAWELPISGRQVWTAVYNFDGSVRRAPAVADQLGSFNGNIDLTATDGGFAFVYDDGASVGGISVVLQRFDADGNFLDIVALSSASGTPHNPQIARMPDGLLAVTLGYHLVGPADSETFLGLYDPVSQSFLAQRTITAGEPLTDDTDFPTIAAHGQGQVAVFHTNVTDTDADGEDLRAVRTSTGDAANDSFTGSAYTDVFNGGGGSDDLSYATAKGGVTVSLAIAGAQNVGGGQATDTLSSIEILIGSNFADSLTGNAAANRFDGRGGNDRMDGGLGGDTYVFAEAGDVIVEAAGGGTDEVIAFTSYSLAAIANVENLSFHNVLGLASFTGTGNSSDNRISSAFGFAASIDTLYGLAGRDSIYSGLGNDRILGGDEAGAGDIWLGGDSGADYITGGIGADRIDGGADGDTFLGGESGADYITGGLGNDRIDGGADGDTWLGGDAGADNITGGLGNDRVDGGADNDTWLGGDAGADYITGGDGDDRIDGGTENDNLNGGAGRDTITGNSGNDTITGGSEAGLGDSLFGDAGIDYIYGGSGHDFLDGGADSDSLSGEDGIDTLSGGLGIDYLYGGAQDDYLVGGDGNDQMTGGANADTFVFDPGTDYDSVLDFTNNVDTIQIDIDFGFSHAAEVVARTIQSGNHARILLNAAGTDSVYLLNYLSPGSGNTIANLGDDIVFA